MKHFLLSALLLAGMSLSPLTSPTLAQGEKKVEFYCGRTQDINPQPVTLAAMHGAQKEIVIIVWSDLKNISARKRCETVSDRFQVAWDRGSFNYVGSGVDRNGLGLICALKDRGQICDSKHTLFTLKNGQQSKEKIQRLQEILGARVEGPIYESNSDFLSIDMKYLIKILSAPGK
jgi:Circadian oscillating protein COP23